MAQWRPTRPLRYTRSAPRIVHSFGLSNDPRPRAKTPKRISLLLHTFKLDASGRELLGLCRRDFAPTVDRASIDPTVVDLRSLGDVVEGLVRDLWCARAAGIHCWSGLPFDQEWISI